MQALRLLVIVLGVLIVLALGLLAYGFYLKANDPGAKLFGGARPKVETVETTSGPLDIRLPLPAGCSIVEMRPDGQRLYLRIGPDGACERIVILDVEGGGVLGSITPAPMVPMPR